MNKIVVNTGSGGIGITGLLLVAFIVLKLTNVIAWSWWLVLSPAWIPIALVVSILIIGVIIFMCVLGVLAFMDWYRER